MLFETETGPTRRSCEGRRCDRFKVTDFHFTDAISGISDRNEKLKEEEGNQELICVVCLHPKLTDTKNMLSRC